MRHGKLILSAASLVVSAGSLLAFTSHSKSITGAKGIYGKTANGCCTIAKSCFTTHSGGVGINSRGKCHTVHQAVNPFTLKTANNGVGRHTMWTARTTVNNCLCSHLVAGWTKTH